MSAATSKYLTEPGHVFPHERGLTDGKPSNPDNDRVGVTVAEYAASDLNGDVSAYLYNPNADEYGLDPWRLIEGVDPPNPNHSPRVETFEIWGVADWSRKVGPRFVIYVLRKHLPKIAKAVQS